VFSLWWTSEEAAGGGGATDALRVQGAMLYESQAFASSLHTLVFAAGATIFYVLFYRSGLLPRPLIGLGLIAAPLALVSQTLSCSAWTCHFCSSCRTSASNSVSDSGWPSALRARYAFRDDVSRPPRDRRR